MRYCLAPILFFSLAAGAATVRVSPYAHPQFLDASGRPLGGGHLCTYAGGTSTPLATYTDSTGITQNSICLSPGVGGILLDAGGYARIWIPFNTAYKFILYDRNGVLQWSEDNILIDAPGPAATRCTTVVSTPTSDMGAAINAAIASIEPGGGTICIPAGNFSASTTATINTSNISLLGAGREATVIHYTGAGDFLRVYDAIFNQTGGKLPAGVIQGLSIIGTPSGVSAVHFGDIIGLTLRDLYLNNFTGNDSSGLGRCLWGDNQAGWTERTSIDDVSLGSLPENLGCSVGLKFTVNGGTSSFGHTAINNLLMSTFTGQVGIQLNGNASVYSSSAVINGNNEGGTSFQLNNTSQWNGNACFVNVEGSGTAVAGATGTTFNCFPHYDHFGQTSTSYAGNLGSGIWTPLDSITCSNNASCTRNAGSQVAWLPPTEPASGSTDWVVTSQSQTFGQFTALTGLTSSAVNYDVPITSSHVSISLSVDPGITGTFAIGGLAGTPLTNGNSPGRVVVISNGTGQAMILKNLDPGELTAANRICTGLGADLTVGASSRVLTTAIVEFENGAGCWAVLSATPPNAAPAGTNTVYRCATAGALPAGALTINAASCGSTTDTGLRVN